MKFVPDQEIDLQDHDILKTGFYVGLLENIIHNTGTAGFVNIGLVGEWGSGKSSIIKTLQKKLTSKKDFAFVVYDAWKYSNDSFRRMFLISLREQLELRETSHFKSFYKNIGQDVSVKQTTSLLYLLSIAALFLGFYFFALKGLFPKSDQLYAATITIVGMMLTIMGRAIVDLKTTQTLPYLFAPEQFEECFNELVNKCLNRDNNCKKDKWAKRPKKYPDYQKLVIVIDNLDRCHKEMAYELLSVLKNFLANHPDVIFIVPFDEDALHKHIVNKPSTTVAEAQEFLRKIFSVMVRVKPFRRFDLYDFTQSLNSKYALDFQPTTVDIISKEYASNPRRIIQFCNSLCAELEGFSIRFDSLFSGKYQSMICKGLLLREEWPEFYKRLCNNPNLLNKPDNPTRDYINSISTLNTFLLVTDFVGRDVEYTVLDKIFSITDRSGKLPPDISDAVINKDIHAIRDAIERKSVDKSLVVAGLIEMLHTAIQRETYDTQVNNLFELICLLNQSNPLIESEHEMVETEIKPRLFNFIEKIGNVDALCNYALSDALHALPYLRNYLLSLIEGGLSDKQKSERHANLRKLLNAYTKYSRKDEKPKLSSIFLMDYDINGAALKDTGYDSDVLDDLCSVDMAKKIIGKIEKLSEEDKNFSDILYLMANIKIQESAIQELYEKLRTLFGQPEFVAPTTLNNLLPLLEKQPQLETSSAINAVQSIYDYFLNDSAFFEISFTVDIDPVVINLMFEISRITAGKVNVNPLLEKLAGFHENLLKIIIDKIHSKLEHPAIPFLAPFILSIHKFNTQKETLDVLQICVEKFHQNNTVNSAEIISLFYDLLLIYAEKNTSQILEQFFEHFNTHGSIAELLHTAALKLSAHPVAKLPPILQPVVMDHISENIKAFEDNIPALRNLALWGNGEQTRVLPAFVIGQLQKGKSQNALQVLCYLDSAPMGELRMITVALNDMLDDNTKRSGLAIVDALQQAVQNPDKPRLVIIHASYYTERGSKDVTAVLSERVIGNRLKETANNDLAGDPDPGVAKKLLVDYTYNGYHLKYEANEHEQIILP